MRRAIACLVLAASLVALSCATRASAAPKVVVTIKPLHALVAQVMDGVGSPVLLVNGLASAHTYSLKPSEARALHDADLLVRMSETVEPFTGRIVRSLPTSALCNGSIVTPQPLLVEGEMRAMPAAIEAMSARACSMEMPGFNRPSTCR